MTKNGLIAKLRETLRAFRAETGGNTAVVFGLALVPVLGLVGAAVDYSRASSMRTSMQAAVDSTALALSSSAAGQSQDALNASASTFFRSLFTRTDAQHLQVTATFSSTSGNTVVVNATASMNTNIMGIMGFQSIPVAATSTASWGSAKLQVALVLDNTGSMSQATDVSGTSKMSALKTASHNLLTKLQNAAANPGDIQVAIIPFNNFVKVDPTTYKTRGWVSYGLNSGSGGDGDNNSQGCNGGDGGDNNDQGCNPTSSTWNGCFTDRNQPYDIQNTAPSATNTNTYFWAVNCSMAQIMPMSNNWTSLNAKIDAMVAAGTTNQPIGLAWGWHALTQSDPMNAPAPPAGARKIIILLTDGLNTQDRWYSAQTSIDNRMYKSTDGTGVCHNIKNDSITIYTVLVGSGNSSILQNCASPDAAAPAGPKYFALTSASQIITTFNTIGTNLAKLHLAR